MSFYLPTDKKYPLISLMERPTTLKRPRNQKGIKGTVMQIKNNCYLIAVGLYPETYFHALGSRLTNICICIDPTFNISGWIILFVGVLRYFKDAIFVLYFLNNIIFLIISLWFGFFLIVILYVILNQSKVNGNQNTEQNLAKRHFVREICVSLSFCF